MLLVAGRKGVGKTYQTLKMIAAVFKDYCKT